MSEKQESQAKPMPVSKKLMHDTRVILSRLVAKAPQILLLILQSLGCMYGPNLMVGRLSIGPNCLLGA